MNTRRVKDPITGKTVDGRIVEVAKENNSPIILEMTDGAVLRMKIDIAEVIRTPTLNSLNEPVYVIRNSPAIMLLEHPTDHTLE